LDKMKLVVARNVENSAELWSMDWPDGKPAAVLDLPANIAAVSFVSPSEVAAACDDGFVRVVDINKKREQRKVKLPFKSAGAFRFSADGATLAASERSLKRKIFLWDWQTDAPIRTTSVPERGADQLVFSPDGKILATCSQDPVN